MNDDEKALHLIVWDRLSRYCIQAPKFSVTDQHFLQSISRNLLPIFQATIASAALFILPFSKIDIWGLAAKFIEYYKAEKPWITAIILILLSCLLPWLFSVVKVWYQNIADRHFIPLAIFIGTVIALAGSKSGHIDLGILAIGIIIFWSGLLAMLLRQEKPTPEIPDKLHRSYFANRLAEIFTEPNGPTKRVAVMGEWGAGKTRVLELIAQRLKKDKNAKFKVISVNPWKAKTAEEAWSLVATEIGAALGHTSIIPKSWSAYPFFKNIIDLLPLDPIQKHLIQFACTQGSESREENARKINASIKHFNRNIIVLVDDMERTPPEVIRQLFPIIDQLSDLNGISFVFAIDPERVSSAFDEIEHGRNGELTKGYLDKVFDLQIDLPPPHTDDIQQMIAFEATRQGAVKLAAALPKFTDLVPSNPRLALRFLELAISKERLFLERYGPKEYSYAPFFLCWLAETEFPGFLKAIQNKAEFDKVNGGLWDDYRPGEIRNHEAFITTVKDIKESLGINKTALPRIEKIIENLIRLCRSPLDRMINGDGRFSLEWAYSGHMLLTELSHNERARLVSQWETSAGEESIDSMIQKEFLPEAFEFVNNSVCANQLVKFEFEKIINLIGKLTPFTPTNTLHSAVVMINESTQRLFRHHRYARESSLSQDLTSFGIDSFTKWIQHIVDCPLTNIDSSSADAIDASRAKLSIEMAHSIPLINAHRYSRWVLNQTIKQRGHDRDTQFAKKHFGELRYILNTRVRDYITECMKNGSLDICLFDTDIAGGDGYAFFYDPENWLWMDSGEWKLTLDNLIEQSASNTTLATSFAELTYSLFVHPSKCDQCGGTHQSERQKVKKLQDDYPGYIVAFWKASLHLPDDNELKKRMITTREIALQKARSGNSSLTPELLHDIFPL